MCRNLHCVSTTMLWFLVRYHVKPLLQLLNTRKIQCEDRDLLPKWLHFSSVSHSVMSHFLRLHGLQHTGFSVHHQLPELTQTHIHWVGDAIQLSHPLLSPSPTSHLQSFPASGSFQMRNLFASGGQSFGVSASASVLPMNIQDWFPLGWTGWICLLSKGLLRVFSNITVQKHQFFGAQFSL